jgi:hypothetical protein
MAATQASRGERRSILGVSGLTQAVVQVGHPIPLHNLRVLSYGDSFRYPITACCPTGTAFSGGVRFSPATTHAPPRLRPRSRTTTLTGITAHSEANLRPADRHPRDS